MKFFINMDGVRLRMDYLSRLLSEVSLIRETLGVECERPIPRSVEPGGSPAHIHATSSLGEDGRLILSSELLHYGDFIIKKEAFSLFIPPEADEVPQVHDLAWAYSGAPRDLWESVRVRPPRPFDNYDPIRLFSLIPRESKLRAIRDTLLYVKASAKRGELSFSLYLHILSRFLGMEIKLTDVDRKVLNVLSTDPYADAKRIKERAGISEASISRSLRKLRMMGCLFGPENVKLWKLGLITVVASFPNRRRYREAFWRFPFTYTQMIPVSGEARVHAYLVVPRASFRDLLGLEKIGVELGIAKRTVQRFNFSPPGDPMTAMVRAYLSSGTSEGLRSFQAEPPPIRLSRTDIRVLNHIMREGKATSSSLSKVGVRSAKQRLGKLRSAGIIGNYYMIGLPIGYEVLLFRISCSYGESDRLASTLASVGTATVSYVEGRRSYCLAFVLSTRELRSGVIRGVRAIYGDGVELAEDVIDVNPMWLLPEELWDERRQTFSWERPLEELLTELRG